MTSHDIRRRLGDLEARLGPAAAGCDTCRDWPSFVEMQQVRDARRSRHELAQIRAALDAELAGLPAPERLPAPPDPPAHPDDALDRCPSCGRARPPAQPLSIEAHRAMQLRADRG